MHIMQPYIIIIILLVTMGLFIWGRWRYDVVALIALTISVALGAVPFDDVYLGFSNIAVITVACVMVISYAITQSGLLNQLIRKLTFISDSPIKLIGSLTLITAILSAFMNNVGALALIMPIAIKTAIDNHYSPSIVLMPIALGSAMGGLCTVIGTPPNLLIAAYRQEYTGHPFSMFAYGHVGLPVAIVGILFITFIGWRLIPGDRKAPKRAEDIFKVNDYITELEIPEESPLLNKTVQQMEDLIKGDLSIIGYIHKKKKKFVLNRSQKFEAGDVLIVESSTEGMQAFIESGNLQLVEAHPEEEILQSDDIALMEAVVSPGSRTEGRSSQMLRLRMRYHVNLLAISRQGKSFRQRLRHVNLHVGDVVLLQGPADTLANSASRLGLLPLVERGVRVGIKKRAFLPIFIFLIAIILAAMQLLPVQIAFGGAVVAMVLFNVIPIRAVYESIEWPIIILLAAMIPIGAALQTTGGTGLIAHYFLLLSGQVSPTVIMVLLLVVTMTISDFMNNAATTVVMAPIAVSIARALHVHIDPYLMAVAIGASCSFLTPVGHQNNTLVMGPGGYKFTDYFRVGLPLELIIVVVSVPFILWAWPL